ncbi:MAG: Mur ligase family protein [Bacteriovoracaceae bacterium]
MNLKNKRETDELIKEKHLYKKIFFYRICGTGMGAAACLLREAGFEISGADQAFFPPMSTYLESTGIQCFKLDIVTPQFLKQFDLIVIGNSVSGKSENARMLEECGVPFTSFPSAIGAFVLRPMNVVGVAGTHGKTTTTYFMAQVFENLGKKPGYLIGGIMDDRAPARLGDGSYFFIEADEYDSCYFQKISKFRLYELKNMVLTSLEFDHADIFSSLEKIEDEFKAAIPNITKNFVFCEDYPSTLKLFEEYKGKTLLNKWAFYGQKSKNGPFDIQNTSKGCSFKVNFGGHTVTFETNLLGIQNILNLTSVIMFAYLEGFAVADIQKAILDLKMVKRRQEVRGTYHGAIVIDDFAHHPRAVELTVESIKMRYPDKEVVVAFEPISATARSSLFQEEFTQSLYGVKAAILAKANIATTAMGQKDLDCDLIVSELKKRKNIPGTVCTDLVSLRSAIDQFVDNKTVLMVLSNRTCLGLWESSFVDELKK